MRRLLIVVLGVSVVTGLVASVAAGGPGQKSREGSTIVLPPGSRSTERPNLPAWMRVGSEAAGPVRPDLTSRDNGNTPSVVRRVPPCSIATITGNWAWINHGNDPTGAPFVAVGTYDLDNGGNSSFRGWVSGGGWAFELPEGSGTVTVNPNCTGTETKSDGSTTFFVILRNGREIWGIPTSPGLFSYIELKKISGPF